MEIFIVRPFGKKTAVTRDKNTGKITAEHELNFDKVETDLIAPAIAAAGLRGGTTGEIFESGDIREDMFSLLLQAEIVIADVTIHNANVFYELGIRHALRDKKTVLIKCSGYDDTPFDIVGYRYTTYKIDDPAAALADLIKALKESRLSDRKDSPVFNLLPNLAPQEHEKLLVVPVDFAEEAALAQAKNDLGRLMLMASEAETFIWKIPAQRLIGGMVFKMKAMHAGRIIWEKIKDKQFNDAGANEKLATIYHRLAELEMSSHPAEGEALLTQSEFAINCLLDHASPDNHKLRAEALSLKGRNLKTRWILTWSKSPEAKHQDAALRSDFLFDAFESYLKAYYEDLNHYYAGINALGILTVIIELAGLLPDTWEIRFDSEDEAQKKLGEYVKIHQQIEMVLRLSLMVEKRRLKDAGMRNPWPEITEADLACLTGKNTARVGLLYQHALEESGPFDLDSAVRQLKIYEQLGIKPDNVQAALQALQTVHTADSGKPSHYLLFTGHMIDQVGRPKPRFPAEKEKAVTALIDEKVRQVREEIAGEIKGIAGGACGGDIIFHEVCKKYDIKTEVFLALPEDQFKVASVQFAGPAWMDRFHQLVKTRPVNRLSSSKEMPGWLQKKQDYTIWERNNLWELYNALVEGGINMTLIALWDGKSGDGPGGTADMVREAKARGAKTIIIDKW